MTMTRGRRQRRIQAVTLAALALVLGVLLAWPTPSSPVRAAIVVGLIVLWAGGGAILWRYLIARILFFVPVVAALALAFAPVREPDFADLRQKYVAALLRYDGTPFRDDGESPMGVDAAGLVRRALLDTFFLEGIKQVNPTLLRAGMALWWHDGDADALVRMVQGKTTILNTDRPNQVPLHRRSEEPQKADTLLPGDLAVSEDKSQVLAYLGDSRWIAADPKAGKVAIYPDTALTAKFRYLRWTKLAP